MDFFWYDYETTGRRLREDRPVQLAGVRTDSRLNRKDAYVNLYCQPAWDSLPQVGACLVHRISPQVAEEKGVTEHEFATRVHEFLTVEETCVVGYNAMKFDHVFTQFLFWRNLRDPYAWHWKHGNSKWDIIELFRAAYALRPEGIKWSARNENGKVAFGLEELAERNGIKGDTRLHDARIDVEVMLEMARLIKRKQPRLFDYYLSLRRRKAVEEQIRKTFIYVSGKVLFWRQAGTIAARLGRDTVNGYILAFDLAYDPRKCFDSLEQSLSEQGSYCNRAVHWFKANASPFVKSYNITGGAGKRVQAVLDRLNLDLNTVRLHWQALQDNPDFSWRVRAAYKKRKSEAGRQDVDAALYDGFVGSGDRARLDAILDSCGTPGAHWEDQPFQDNRLPELVFRFRARNFPDSLRSGTEKERWVAYCRHKLFEKKDDKGITAFEQYRMDIRVQRLKNPDGETRELLSELEAYGQELKSRLRA